MIDGISFRLPPERIRNSDILDFKPKGNRLEAKYQGLRVSLYADSAHVSGSIHKYYNDGAHNSDDFHLSAFIQALNDLALTFDFNPDAVPFNTFEFGVNISMPFDPVKFIESLVYTKKGVVKGNGKGIEIQLTEYRIKIYLKTTSENTTVLRYEIRIDRTRGIRKKVEAQGANLFCSALSDLKNPKVWEILGNALLEAYDTFLFIDIDSFTNISSDEYRWLCNARNSSYWINHSTPAERKKKQRELKNLKKFISERSTNTTFQTARKLINDKITELIDVENIIELHPESVTKSPTVQTPKKGKMSQNPHLDNVGKCDTSTQKKKVCKVTGLSLDIGIRQGAYLSAKGVEYYYLNNLDIFTNELLPRLSTKWKDSPLKIQYREIAHSIRNELYNPKNNPRNNFKRDAGKIMNGCIQLFSLAETIRPDKRRLYEEVYNSG